MLTETAPLPPQNGVGSNDHKRLSPPGPDPGQRHPEKPISRAELRPGRRSLVDGELLVQGEVFEGELAMAAAKKGQEAKQLEQEGDHRTRIFAGSEPADQPLPAGLNFGDGQSNLVANGGLVDEVCSGPSCERSLGEASPGRARGLWRTNIGDPFGQEEREPSFAPSGRYHLRFLYELLTTNFVHDDHVGSA